MLPTATQCMCEAPLHAFLLHFLPMDVAVTSKISYVVHVDVHSTLSDPLRALWASGQLCAILGIYAIYVFYAVFMLLYLLT
jgi:hypothetical protein